MKYADSIHKLFAVSISIILASGLYSGVLFPHYLPLNATFHTGSAIILFSAIAYYILAGNKHIHQHAIDADTSTAVIEKSARPHPPHGHPHSQSSHSPGKPAAGRESTDMFSPGNMLNLNLNLPASLSKTIKKTTYAYGKADV